MKAQGRSPGDTAQTKSIAPQGRYACFQVGREEDVGFHRWCRKRCWFRGDATLLPLSGHDAAAHLPRRGAL